MALEDIRTQSNIDALLILVSLFGAPSKKEFMPAKERLETRGWHRERDSGRGKNRA